MSNHYYLYCESTGECVEAVAHVGNTSSPRIDANALGAFLLYHQLTAGVAPLVLIQLESLDDDRSGFESLSEAAQERESIGDFHGYKPPILIWTKENYHEFSARRPGLVEMLKKFESKAGMWKLSTGKDEIVA